jgi:hypothetical protein
MSEPTASGFIIDYEASADARAGGIHGGTTEVVGRSLGLRAS